MAAVLANKCCVWELPPESFTLDESTYRGLTLLKVIDNLTQVEDRHLIPTTIAGNPRVSYTVHVAHKLAAWILHIRSEEFVTSLENRAISESVHASFLNLTEFKSVMIDVLIPCLVFYLMVYDRDFLNYSITYFDDIFSSKKTSYDVFLDTIMACGKASSLYAWTGLSASGRKGDLRSTLYLALTQCVDSGYLRVMERGAFLTPDNAEKVFPRQVRLILRLLGEPMPPAEVSTYEEYVEFVAALPQAVRRHIPRRVVHTEEEAVSYVRTEEPTDDLQSLGVTLLRDPSGGLITTRGLRSSQRMIKLALPYHASQLGCSLMCALQGFSGVPQLRGRRLVTLGDPEGELFNLVNHVLKMKGFPHWPDADEGSNLWERGPLACATDPCDSGLLMSSFFANITHPQAILINKLYRDQVSPEGHLIIHTKAPDLASLLEVHYGGGGDTKNLHLYPWSACVGMELDDPDWVSLPGVIPPFDLEESPLGSQWVLLGRGVEELVIAPPETMASYKNLDPGVSPHLVSTITATSWNSEQARHSLLATSSCFNMFGPLLRVLSSIPITMKNFLREIKERLMDRSSKMKNIFNPHDTSTDAAADEGIRGERRNTKSLGAQIYILYILSKLVILSDLNTVLVQSMRDVHCHHNPHSVHVCYSHRCCRDGDSYLLPGKREALGWANHNLETILVYSTVIDRLGDSPRYHGPQIRLQLE